MILGDNQSTSPSSFGTEFFGDEAPSAEATSRPENRTGKSPGKTITVLIAEDRTSICQAFGASFRPEDGIEVIGHASESGHVLGLVEKHRPDVVVMAMRMALRIGLETIRRVLKARWGSELLVLLPKRECPFAKHVTVAGAAGYLTEQDSPEVMAAKIRKARESSKSAFGGFGGHKEIEPEKESTRLTAREREALELIADGHANKQVADLMRISIKTVQKHRQHVMDKLGIHETATLTRYALYAGIVH